MSNLPASVQLVIYGAGSLGREVLSYSGLRPRVGVQPISRVMFLDDGHTIGSVICGAHVGAWGDVNPLSFCVVAIADPTSRAKVSMQFMSRAIRINALRFQAFGLFENGARDSIMLPHSFVSCDSRANRGLIMNVFSSVGHDCMVGRYATLGPYAAVLGDCHIGDRVFIGAHATICPGVTVGDDAYICAGSVITADVPANARMMGNPARRIG